LHKIESTLKTMPSYLKFYKYQQ